MPAAWPSLSHFCCSFQGRAVSPEEAGSARSWGGSLVAQEAKETAALISNANLSAWEKVELRISASIHDDISGLNLDAARQATANDIADGRCRFN